MWLSSENGDGDCAWRRRCTVVEFRNEKQSVYGALVEHRLRREGGQLPIAHKRVDLVNSEGELDGIAILF